MSEESGSPSPAANKEAIRAIAQLPLDQRPQALVDAEQNLRDQLGSTTLAPIEP